MTRRPSLFISVACACVGGGLLGTAIFEAGSGRAEPSRAAAIGIGPRGGFLVGGRPRLLVALSNPPELSTRTPLGRSGPAEVVGSGVNLLRVGPAWTGWTHRELEHVLAWERTAARLGVHLWVRLNTFAATHPRWRGDAHLSAIVHALTSSPFAGGIGLWQGADEPRSRGITAPALAFVYCRLTSRGDPRACAGEPPLDPQHLLVTILAPHGNRASFAPYSRVTDGLGVDVYPITVGNHGSANLHRVGVWTRAVAAVTPNHAVWTTLQICSRNAFDKRTQSYVLPTAYQERYMVYDAIINGARGVAFFGGNNPHCWNRSDRRYGWNWTFWNTVLDQLIEQIGRPSAFASALGDAASAKPLRTSDRGSEAISRSSGGRTDRRLWVIAARSRTGVNRVAISGLPRSVKSATVYGEGRAVHLSRGTLEDTFRQWQVHVYELRLRASR